MSINDFNISDISSSNYEEMASNFCGIDDKTLNDKSLKSFDIARKILKKGGRSLSKETRKSIYVKIDAIFCSYGSEENVKSFLRARNIYRIPNNITRKAMKDFFSMGMSKEKIGYIIEGVRVIEKKRQWFLRLLKWIFGGTFSGKHLLKNDQACMDFLKTLYAKKNERAKLLISSMEKISGKRKVKECSYKQYYYDYSTIKSLKNRYVKISEKIQFFIDLFCNFSDSENLSQVLNDSGLSEGEYALIFERVLREKPIKWKILTQLISLRKVNPCTSQFAAYYMKSKHVGGYINYSGGSCDTAVSSGGGSYTLNSREFYN